jgi:hypothetical protein
MPRNLKNAEQEFYLSYGLSNSIVNPTYTEDSGIILIAT